MSTQTPDEKLTAVIIEKLREQRLIPTSKLAELQTNIAKGTMRAVDWRSLIDLALLREKTTEQEAQDE